jgi:hypothetical protein
MLGCFKPMQTVRFTIPSLDDPRNADDLINTLIGVSGVSHIAVDAASQTLSVEYDPDYLDARSLDFFINAAGYSVAIAQGEPRP